MSDPGDVDLDEVYGLALRLAKEAGQMLTTAMNARCNGNLANNHVEKESAVDLVTQADEGQCVSVAISLC